MLADMLSPLIEKTVFAAMNTAVKAAIVGLKSSVIEGMNKSNKDLQDTVTKQNKYTSIGFHKNLDSSLAIKFCCNRIVLSRLEGK